MPPVHPDVPTRPTGHGSLFVLAAVNVVTVTTLVLRHHEPGGSAPADLVPVGTVVPGLGSAAVLHWADIVIAGANLLAVLLCLLYVRTGAAAQGGRPRSAVFDAAPAPAAEQAKVPVSPAPPRAPEPAAADPLPEGLEEFPSEAESPTPRRVAS